MILLSAAFALFAVSPTANADELSDGRQLYIDHCAACHGINGDGHGPLEHELAKPAADLRILSKRYGNPLPYDQIARFMDGRADVKAHGSRDMPVWGEEMWKNPPGKGNPNEVSEPVAKIIRYLQSIQITGTRAAVKTPPAAAPSGKEL
jgi:mono/diheme cytochrome c family protein